MTNSNRHPVDRLADVNAQIKALTALREDIKIEVSDTMADGHELHGEEYVAVQTLTTRKGAIDTKALKAAGVDVDKYRKADVAVYTLKVMER